MAMAKSQETVDIVEVKQGQVEFCILGRTPIILNRMSQKAIRTILMPSGPKSRADKASNLKHNPIEEYRASPYKTPAADKTAKTRLLIPATAFKSAICNVATDLPGAAKAQIGRLTYVVGDYVALYGIPQLSMMVTRLKDMARTPDVRSRAIVPQWACRVVVNFTMPILKAKDIVNLMSAAGLIQGIGDYRPEKGKGTYGQFEIVRDDDARFVGIVKAGGRVAQDAALEAPGCYDDETAELLSWFTDEVTRRGFKIA